MHLNLSPVLGATPTCRHCGSKLGLTLANLGLSPVANDYVDPVNYARAEPFYPLEALVCRECRLVQTCDILAAGTFSERTMPISLRTPVHGWTTPGPMSRTWPGVSD